ncbi:hypothetical protein TL16_g11672 [Triparma laevis f. inornata]|uniref:Uncharacterized protein n=1 Tax=Triparma laevis f. inornata TaxID=1714386 RepID=A0A9W7BKF1_9STRA|nr:hypothetical protein TL16_g11672 [Triparma laevis f. inornata]
MGKLSKRKRQKLEASMLAASYSTDTQETLEDAESSSSHDPLHPPSASTLTYLIAVAAAPPSETYWSPDFKPLRRAIFPFVQLSLSKYVLPDYPALTTTLLTPPNTLQGFQQAILYLTAIRDLHVKVKQGTIQRWVRMVDECESDSLKVKLLSSIVGCQAGQDDDDMTDANVNKHDAKRALEELIVDGTVNPTATTTTTTTATTTTTSTTSNDDDKIVDMGTFIIPPQPPMIPISLNPFTPSKSNFSEIVRIKGPDRKPPNLHDLTIRMTSDPICNPSTTTNPNPHPLLLFPRPDLNLSLVKKHPLPAVPGAFVLSSVLTSSECSYIKSTTEAMGYSKNEVSGKADTEIGECEWLTCSHPSTSSSSGEKIWENPDGMLGAIFERTRPHLPKVGGKSAVGINSRWRSFRYKQGGVYRMHIDGSWSAAGLGEKGEMVNDVTDGR